MFLKSEIEEENGERRREGRGRKELVGGEDVDMGELQERRLFDSHGHMGTVRLPI